MNLKTIINDFIQNNETVVQSSKKLFNNFESFKDTDKIISPLAEMIIETKYNPALGTDFTTVLQLINDEKLLEQHEMEDIQKLLYSLIKLQESNLDFYVEIAHLEWAFFDDAAKAKECITKGIEKAKLKIDELEKLLAEINDSA